MMFKTGFRLQCRALKPRITPRVPRSFSSSTRILNRYRNQPNYQTPRPQQPQYDQYDQYEEYNNYYQPPRWFAMNSSKIITGGLIFACTGVTGYHYLLEKQFLTTYSSAVRAHLAEFQEHFTMTYQGLKSGKYYTILTSALNHNGIYHYAFNMLGLWSFGRSNIMLFGPTMTICLLTGSILAGGVAQYYWWQETRDTNAAGVGISGGVFGLVAAQALVLPRGTIMLSFVPMPMWLGLGISVAASVAGLKGVWGDNIGHANHLGGMAFGAVFWAVVLRGRGGRMRYF